VRVGKNLAHLSGFSCDTFEILPGCIEFRHESGYSCCATSLSAGQFYRVRAGWRRDEWAQCPLFIWGNSQDFAERTKSGGGMPEIQTQTWSKVVAKAAATCCRSSNKLLLCSNLPGGNNFPAAT
jgi:hypothetical protein